MNALFTSSNVVPLLLRKTGNSGDTYLTMNHFRQGIKVQEQISRNRTFVVSLISTGDGYFLKQASILENERLKALIRESKIYKGVRDMPYLQHLKAYFPIFEFYESEYRIQVTRLIKGNTLREWLKIQLSNSGRLPSVVLLFEQLGYILDQCHSSFQRIDFGVDFAFMKPLILSDNFPESLKNDNVRQIYHLLKPYLSIIEEAATEWNYDFCIHGDLKLSNVMVREPEFIENPSLILTDWELAVKADARWDFGMIIGAWYEFVFESKIDKNYAVHCVTALLRPFASRQSATKIIQMAGLVLLQKIVNAFQDEEPLEERTIQAADYLLKHYSLIAKHIPSSHE
jgi:thiamine kinase-like enzyme